MQTRQLRLQRKKSRLVSVVMEEMWWCQNFGIATYSYNRMQLCTAYYPSQPAPSSSFPHFPKSPIPTACLTPSTGPNHPALCSEKISTCGFKTVLNSSWSSTGPARMNLVPGATSPARHIMVPHVLQKAFVILRLVVVVWFWAKMVRLSSPRM